jgi:UDP-N-acetylglucosamine 4-epimerase
MLRQIIKPTSEFYNLHIPKEQVSSELAKNVEVFQSRPAIYRDFRAGDIRHSNANITKAQMLVGYAPTHTIEQGMEEAIQWYITNSNSIKNKNNFL